MKKFLAAVFASLALILTGIVAAPAANAAPSIEASASVEVVKATPAVHITKAQPKGIGGGIIKPLYQWLPPQYCYWQSGITSYSYYCYRYDCTYFERVAWGCYNGYVRINTSYWA